MSRRPRTAPSVRPPHVAARDGLLQVAAWGGALLFAACGGSETTAVSPADLRDVVVVTSAPAEAFTRWVLPDATIENIVPAGVDPGAWSPDDAALDALVSARAVVTIGDPELEPWTQRVALPPSRTIEAAGALPKGAAITVGTVAHSHGDGPAHSHGGTVATYWTDPDLVAPLALAVADGLERAGFEVVRPKGGPAPWESDVAALRTALVSLGDAVGDRALLASDHGFEYLARAADAKLRVALLECDDERPTSPAGIAQLDEFASQKDASGLLVVFGEGEANAARAAAEEFGAPPFVFDLGFRSEASGDTYSRLTRSIEELARALAER